MADDQLRQWCAIHEAGHALAALRLGLEVREAFLADGHGGVWTRVGSGWAGATVAMGGYAAEDLVAAASGAPLQPTPTDPTGRKDVADALEYVTADQLDTVAAYARRLLRPHYRALRAVARELHEAGHLSGQRIVDIVRQ